MRPHVSIATELDRRLRVRAHGEAGAWREAAPQRTDAELELVALEVLPRAVAEVTRLERRVRLGERVVRLALRHVSGPAAAALEAWLQGDDQDEPEEDEADVAGEPVEEAA